RRPLVSTISMRPVVVVAGEPGPVASLASGEVSGPASAAVTNAGTKPGEASLSTSAPDRARRRQVNNWLALMSVRRAPHETDAPGEGLSATIRCSPAALHARRRARSTTSSPTTAIDRVHHPISGHHHRDAALYNYTRRPSPSAYGKDAAWALD